MTVKNKIVQEKVKIISQKKLGADYFCLTLESERIAKSAIPGQFVQIKVSSGDTPLLRRPFGVHRVKGKIFDVLCQVVGPATRILSQKKTGECLDVLGPLGNGFDYRLQAKDYKLILVAGGMGVAPLLFLAEKLTGHKPLVLIGAKTKRQILCLDEFKKLGCEVKIATDDGSMGFKGRVTGLLNNILRATSYKLRANLYACGPKPMLQEVSRLAKTYHLAGQISLEEHLSCGIGACLGCVVNTKEGFQRVCKEGPVFLADQIIWGKE